MTVFLKKLLVIPHYYSHLLNDRITFGRYEIMLPAPMMLRTSWVLPKMTISPSPSTRQLCALLVRGMARTHHPQAIL